MVVGHEWVSELRAGCAEVAERAWQVRIEHRAIERCAASLALDAPSRGTAGAAGSPDLDAHLRSGTREELAAFWLSLDAVNFGSGWFPTLRKRGGRSGYLTIAGGIRERFAVSGPWSATELGRIDAVEIAGVLGQDPAHELMRLFALSLNDLGRHVAGDHDGRFAALVDSAAGSAVELVSALNRWDCFADSSRYHDLVIPFRKRAQLAAADLAGAGVADFADLDRLTMFADNLVPHVLRLDGVLSFADALVGRIERGEPIEHGSPEEVEIRACALHAVELIVAARPGVTAAEVDQLLWYRGQQPRYKACPRHRSRCTAY